MWGINCIFTAAILFGFGSNLYLREEYSYEYMDSYIVPFTIVSLVAFTIAHKRAQGKGINLAFSVGSLDTILRKYKFIMWLNFIGGILRIVAMVSLVGFSLDNVMDYRMAANNVMMGFGGGLIMYLFKITSYIQLLANIYVAVAGLKTGFGKLKLKHSLTLFILYAPTQMATGGRLFVLFFILFFFGSFLLGRGLALKQQTRRWLENSEKRIIVNMFAVFIVIIGVIGIIRAGATRNADDERLFEKFAYISEGTLATDYLMRFYPGGTFEHEYGTFTLGRESSQMKPFFQQMEMTKMSSIVYSIITFLYLDFGYWGSIIVWFFLALFMEIGALKCLNRLTLFRFIVFSVLLKMAYESILGNSIGGNIPVFQLLVILYIFYDALIGKYESRI
jgi:oligosaccharide repeat unit polymerase